MMISVLIAGEDAVRRTRLASPLISQGYYIIEAESGARASDLLKRRQNIALALIDVEMADISGVDFIANIRAARQKIPIIALAGSEDDERLRRAVAAGADDFLIYPISSTRLSVSVGNLLQKHMLRRGVQRRAQISSAEPVAVSRWASDSAAMRELLQKAEAAAKTGGILLICGEADTGRAALARAIHEESHLDGPQIDSLDAGDEAYTGGEAYNSHAQKSAAPFVFVPCTAIAGENGYRLPDNAVLEKQCAFAAGGTLCFGDIDRLDKSGQAQFLHFIERQADLGHILQKRPKNRQEGESGQKEAGRHEGFRLIVIAAADLEELVTEGSFSIGLYKKLGMRVLNVPPLRARREDIPEMAQYILARLVSETGHSALSGISSAAQTLLVQYDWPGNFTELENILFRAVLSSEGRLLVARDFPQLADMGEEQSHSNDMAVSAQFFYDSSGHIKPLAIVEKEAILEAMQRYRGKISEVARRLRIGRSTLYRKLEEYGLYPDNK